MNESYSHIQCRESFDLAEEDIMQMDEGTIDDILARHGIQSERDLNWKRLELIEHGKVCHPEELITRD